MKKGVFAVWMPLAAEVPVAKKQGVRRRLFMESAVIGKMALVQSKRLVYNKRVQGACSRQWSCTGIGMAFLNDGEKSRRFAFAVPNGPQKPR